MAAPEEPPTYFYIGQHDSKRTAPVTSSQVSGAYNAGYDMITSPISNAAYRSKVQSLLSEYQKAVCDEECEDEESVPFPIVPSLTPEHTNLTPDDSISSLLAFTSQWIDLASPDPAVAHVSRHVFNQEIAYAAFCGVNNVVVPGPRHHGDVQLTQYARAISHALSIGPYLQMQILLPMSQEPKEGPPADPEHFFHQAREFFMTEADDESLPSSGHYESWDAWNLIRSVSKFHGRLSVGVSVPRQLPPMSLQSRWFSEPLRFIVFPESSFIPNNKGYPVLSKASQEMITRYMRLKTPPWVLLQDVGSVPDDNPVAMSFSPSGSLAPTPAEAARSAAKPKDTTDPTSHLRYLRHLQATQPQRSMVDRFAVGYQDYLQSPLQPLTDNLESITYEVFEKDPIKYEWYQRAVALALQDLHQQIQGKRPIVVAVVGAGRGPLVTRVLRASADTGVPVSAWAVEKNPNAYVLLQRHNLTNPLWNKSVTVVKTDMRAWQGPILPSGEVGKVDILVSELLGSFADNELSPECLDGVQHVLHPDHGINIPQSYTAHLTPLATPKIHQDLSFRSGDDKWELPYVVMLHQFDYLSLANLSPEKGGKADAEPIPDVQQAWEFSHPLAPAILTQSKLRQGGSAAGGSGGAVGGDGANEHNARFSRMRFMIQNRGVCHGLGGYFESVLYEARSGKQVELSTNPVTMDEKSKDMISWFPIIFPLKTPLHVPDNGEMDVSMWRQTDDRKVWFEWMVEVFHRVDGKRYRLGASELHSSWKNACLM